MAKISTELKELQRVVNRVSPLEGICIQINQRRYLVSVEKLIDPEPLVRLLQQEESEEPARLDALQETFSLKSAPQLVTTKWLALMQRELRRLESQGLLAVIQEHPKLFKNKDIDARWLSQIRQTHDAVCAPPAADGDLSHLLTALLGEDVSAWVSAACAALVEEYATRPQRAAQRVELLAQRVSGRPNLFEESQQGAPIEEYAKQAIDAQKLPGRARKKKLWQIVAALYSWPETSSKEHDGEARQGSLSVRLPDALREILSSLRRQTRPRGVAEYKSRAEYTLSCAALLFRPETTLSITPEMLATLQKKWRSRKRALDGKALSLSQVLRILSLPLKSKKNYPDEESRLQSIASWIQGGLALEELEAVAQKGLLPELLEQAWDLSVARSYCRWVLQLAPHYEQQGVRLALTAKTFSQLKNAKNEELAMLAQCLLEQEATRSKSAAQSQIAMLDATLSMFQKIPQSFRDCLKGLDEIPDDLAVKHFPEFSAWLKETNPLNKYLYYCSLLGEAPALSNSLLEDFSRAERRRAERVYLSSLSNPNELQKQMLSRLSAEEAPSEPARTIRRLEERCNELLQRVYQARLDMIIAKSFLRAYGLSLPKITPAWRDVFRFYMNVDKNQEWLGLLLQKATAQPGQYFAPSLPENQRWLEEASNHFDTNAWISPRRKSATLSNNVEVRIELEEDPIEVLRMGVPFDTCLSLEEGSNAPATVLNALDVNKRVIYARRDNEIVARQLLAISTGYRLLCYRFYSSLDEALSDELEAKFNELIASLEQEAKLTRSGHGRPATIHNGFWYDDGVVFTGSEAQPSPVLRAYCESLSLPIPRSIPDSLYKEAALWSAFQEGRVDDVIALLPFWFSSVLEISASGWVYQRLGAAECIKRARTEDKLYQLLFYHTAKQGLRELIKCLRQIAPNEEISETLYESLRDMEVDPNELLALAVEVNRLASRSTSMNDHGIEHGLAYELPDYIERLSIRQIFDLCDQAEPLWDWVLSEQPSCDVCIDSATSKILDKSVHAYLKDPAQREVLLCLEDKRRSALSRSIALRLTALFPMYKRERRSYHALNWLERGIASEVSVRNTLREMSRDQRFAKRPDLLAAMLRQGASQEEINALPRCHKQPLEALDNLWLQIPWLGAWIQKTYPMPKDGPEQWSPRLWDYYFHRRFVTPWRKALRSYAEENEKESPRMINFLTSIGDSEQIERLVKGRETSNPKNTKGNTERIVWQLEPTNFDEFQAAWRDVRRDEVDASLLAAALRYLQGPDDDEQSLTRALTIVLSAEVSDWIKLEVIERFTREGIPRPLVFALREAEVHERRLYQGLPIRLLFGLWEEASLRSFIMLDLSRMYGNGAAARYLKTLMQAASEMKYDATAFISAWVESLMKTGCIDELRIGRDKDIAQWMARMLLRTDAINAWVHIYGELPDAFAASWFLEVLDEAPSVPVDAIEEALKKADGITWEERAMRFEWLRQRVSADARPQQHH